MFEAMYADRADWQSAPMPAVTTSLQPVCSALESMPQQLDRLEQDAPLSPPPDVPPASPGLVVDEPHCELQWLISQDSMPPKAEMHAESGVPQLVSQLAAFEPVQAQSHARYE
jgi:hypothetical protein